MGRWTSNTLRAGFIVGFLIVLPVMAMPRVAALLDLLLYGESESTLPASEIGDSTTPPKSKTADGATALQVLPIPTESPSSSELPVELNSTSPFPALPAMRTSPDFVRQVGNSSPENDPARSDADVGPLDQATADKIDAVRSRLEELGAEYVRIEMSEDGKEFHCLCHMLLSTDPSEVQPFEATRKDPVAAAQAVLAGVEAWRTAESNPGRASKSGLGGKPR